MRARFSSPILDITGTAVWDRASGELLLLVWTWWDGSFLSRAADGLVSCRGLGCASTWSYADGGSSPVMEPRGGEGR